MVAEVRHFDCNSVDFTESRSRFDNAVRKIQQSICRLSFHRLRTFLASQLAFDAARITVLRKRYFPSSLRFDVVGKTSRAGKWFEFGIVKFANLWFNYERLQSDKMIDVTEIERKLTWNLSLFYATRLAVGGDLSDAKYDMALQYLNGTLKTLRTKNAHLCLKSLLSDGVFIDHFRPLGHEHVLARILTSVVAQFRDDELPREFSKWLFPYRRK